MSINLISVVIPVYNILNYIERCAASVQSQKGVALEVLLIDDGSTDGSGALCDALAERDSRITVYHKPNGGLSDARNYGLEHAHGDYILFLDGDDYLNEGALAKLQQEVQQHPADIVVGSIHFLREEPVMTRWEQGIREHAQFHTEYTGKEYLLLSLRCSDLRVEIGRHFYRTAFLRENELQFHKGILHEDEEFTPRALLAAQSVVLTDEVIYHYDNCRADSITNAESLSTRRAEDRLRVYDSLGALYDNVTPRELRRRLQDNLCWKYLDVAARFDCSSLPGYRPQRGKMLRYAYTPKRRIKALLFALSPAMYRRVMGA